jgi:hypothetical protein
VNQYDLILALHDGAIAAGRAGDAGLCAALHSIVDSLAESGKHQSDLHGWRMDEVRGIFERGSRSA